jgi:hypothetical protein
MSLYRLAISASLISTTVSLVGSPRARQSWISASLLSVLSMTPYESVISRLSTSLSL